MNEEFVHLPALISEHFSANTSGGPNFTPAVRNRGWNDALRAVAVELGATSADDVDASFNRLDREHEARVLAGVELANAERRAERVNSGERVRAW